MIILGITRSHDAGAAIIEDGRIISAVNEERLNRIKMYWGYPEKAINEVIRIAGIKPSDIDLVAVSNTTFIGEMDGSDSSERSKKQFGGNLSLSKKAYYYLTKMPSLVNSQAFYGFTRFFAEALSSATREDTKRRLRKLGIKAKIRFIDHHSAHGFSAYLTSGFKKTIIYTLDFAGDFLCCRVSRANGKDIEQIQSIPFYSSPAIVYNYITKYLGFTPGKHEGKITGLAAYGNPKNTKNIFEKYLALSNDSKKYERRIPGFWYNHALEMFSRDLGKYPREDVAAGLQAQFEEVITKHIANFVDEKTNIVLAGGAFANVKLNQRILEMDGIENIFIHPHMGDGGLGVGAALGAYFEESGNLVNEKLDNVYFGEGFIDEYIKEKLDEEKLDYWETEDVGGEVAELISKDNVVARFDGRMEYGPRALGNRSVLYGPQDKSVNDWLNKRLKRSEFMPFAPVTLERETKKSYLRTDGGEYAARFMTITFECTDWFKENCPAVTHVDNTARPQIISRKINKDYYEIVDGFRKLTGIGTIVNTSFNMHEEPIVCTPQDAIRSFKQGNLDYLSIGKFIAKSK